MLEQFLVSEIFAFFVVFSRLGTTLMFLPGFGEAYVPARVRLFLGAILSLLLMPIIKGMPPVPKELFTLVYIITAEILVGLVIGGLSRLAIAAVHMASMIIAYQSSLASAVTQDINITQGQGTSLNNLLGISAIILLFSTGLHHVMLRGIADSYTLFLPGQFPSPGDIAEHAAQSMGAAFRMAMQMAAPHLIIGLILYLAAGILAKLMPNIQIFFIMMAPQLTIAFFILMVSFSAIMLWYMEYFKTTLSGILTP